jgi:hypothetical protein
MWGRRPANFYRNLKALYNVVVVDPGVSTFDLSRKATATISVTGTAGWEAYLLGRPVVVLGNVFYDFLPGVLRCSLDKNFMSKLTDYLSLFSCPKEERRDAYRAYYACSLPVKYIDIGETISRNEATTNAEAYARHFKEFVRKFASEFNGNFPPDMLDAPPTSIIKAAKS